MLDTVPFLYQCVHQVVECCQSRKLYQIYNHRLCQYKRINNLQTNLHYMKPNFFFALIPNICYLIQIICLNIIISQNIVKLFRKSIFLHLASGSTLYCYENLWLFFRVGFFEITLTKKNVWQNIQNFFELKKFVHCHTVKQKFLWFKKISWLCFL